MAETKRACTTCVLCLRRDYGYSNWTCEGTTLECLAGLNDGLEGQEEPYAEVTPELAALLDVALTCPKYREGAPATLDVETEGLPYNGEPITAEIVKAGGYTDDNEAAELLAKRQSPPAPRGALSDG